MQLPDNRDWEIIEELACDGADLKEFEPAHVKRVREAVMITDEQYEQLVGNGRLKPEDLEGEREKNKAITDAIFAQATNLTYQLSNGIRRQAYVCEARPMYDAFRSLVDYDGGEVDENIVYHVEGWHNIICINRSAIDYVMLPTHQYENARVEADAEDMQQDE